MSRNARTLRKLRREIPKMSLIPLPKLLAIVSRGRKVHSLSGIRRNHRQRLILLDLGRVVLRDSDRLLWSFTTSGSLSRGNTLLDQLLVSLGFGTDPFLIPQ